MKRENLVKRLGKGLGKKVLPYVLSGALAFLNYGCGDVNEFVESKPEKPEEPVVMLAPVAMLTANPTEGDAPLEVYLNGEESSCDPSCSITEYRFDFNNDGIIDKVSEQPGIYHTYEEARIYQTSLEVLDSRGQVSDKDLETIVVKFVESKKPIAILTADPTKGTVPLRVYLNGEESSCDPSCSIIEYHFDFDGEGNTDRVSEYPWVYYTYENAGTYKPTLFVKDSKGQESDKALEKIVVNEEIAPLDQIAFWRNIDGNEDIYLGDLIDEDLMNIQRLTTHSGQDLHPAWSPDGEYLSWATNRDGLNSIYVMNADGTNKRKLTPFINTDFLSPSWSPDGTEIAFAFIDRGWGTNGIAKMNSDGSELIIKIFENSGIGYLPEGIHWSKDGRIFYNDIIEGNSEIFSVNPDDGSDKIRITNTFHNEALPDVSPIGNRLVFVSDQFGGEFSGLEIMSMAIDGTDIRRITNTYEMEVDPKYSNEGTKLLYSRWNSVINAWQMYLSNPDGTAEIPLFVDGRYSAWKPKIEDLNFNKIYKY